MRTSSILSCCLPLLFSVALRAQQPSAPVLMDVVGDTGFVRVEASFSTLSPREQELGFWLTQAAIAVDPIVYDQFSRFGLRQKRLLEGIVAHPGSDPAERKILAFTKLFWANHGNHNDTTSRKFLPEFSSEDLSRAAHDAQKHGAFSSNCAMLPAIMTGAQLDRELKELQASFFDPQFEPMLTAKSPGPGQDILQASSNTFYAGVTLNDLKGFVESNPLNSRLVKKPEGKIQEIVYRAGTRTAKSPPDCMPSF